MNDQKIEYGPLTLAGEAALLNFYNRMLATGNRLKDFYRWRKNGEPHSGGTHPFVARLDGRILGTVNAVPITLTYEGKLIRAVWQQDSVVAPVFRGKGIGKKLVDVAATECAMVMAKGTSDVMYGLRKSVGFVDVKNSNYLICVLSLFRSKLDFKRRLAFLCLYYLSKSKAENSVRSKLRTYQVRVFDSSFDTLAESLSKSCEIMPYKDSNYLNWRYFHCPGREYFVIRTDAEDQLRGAVVLRLNKVPGETAWIVDMICDSKDGECINELLNAALKEFKVSQAADARTFSTSSQARKWLFKRGFIDVKITPRFTFRVEKNNLGFNPQAVEWNFWHGDGDVDLYD